MGARLPTGRPKKSRAQVRFGSPEEAMQHLRDRETFRPGYTVAQIDELARAVERGYACAEIFAALDRLAVVQPLLQRLKTTQLISPPPAGAKDDLLDYLVFLAATGGETAAPHLDALSALPALSEELEQAVGHLRIKKALARNLVGLTSKTQMAALFLIRTAEVLGLHVGPKDAEALFQIAAIRPDDELTDRDEKTLAQRRENYKKAKEKVAKHLLADLTNAFKKKQLP